MYNEPQVATQGWHELAAYREAFHQQVPGDDFESQSFASHHRQRIATWNRLDGRGQTIGAGTNGSRRPPEQLEVVLGHGTQRWGGSRNLRLSLPCPSNTSLMHCAVPVG